MHAAHGNPWTKRRVLAYAHQGGAWEAPSSTLFAVRRALELGVTGIELDVHATADRRLVVCHDATVDRTTDGHGAIHSLTLAELRALDNAHWFVAGADVTPGRPDDAYLYRGRAPQDLDFAVATLEEVLDLLEDYPGVALNLDIKQTAPAVEPYEQQLAVLLLGRDVVDRVIVASFLDAATDAFSRYAPEVATSDGTLATATFIRAVRQGEVLAPMRHVALQVPVAHGEVQIVDQQLVDSAHDAGVAVHVWTVNDAPSMDQLLEFGVDGIITDRPSMLVDVLDRQGMAATI